MIRLKVALGASQKKFHGSNRTTVFPSAGPVLYSLQDEPLMIDVAQLEDADRLVLVQEEPALDLALPRVFRRPAPPAAFTRGRIPVAALVQRAREAHQAGAAPQFGEACGELFIECQPALQWAAACWDYLLSTEGCRFMPREMGERRYHRSNYRAVTEPDYARLVHRTFKDRLLAYVPAEHGHSFTGYLRQSFWPALRDQYRQLNQPVDARHRTLTPLSYLRCTPYQFLNEYHEGLVREVLRALAAADRRVLERYYLQFFTTEAAGEATGLTPPLFETARAVALRRLRGRSALAYHLLRQIERY